MKIYFYGMDVVSPDCCKQALEVLYRHLDSMNPKLTPGLPSFYVPIRDVDGDSVFLADDEYPDQEISWEVRSTPRQAPGSEKFLVWEDPDREIYIYQHFDNRPRGR